MPSPADAHDASACGAHHEVTAAGGSSIIEFAGAAPRRPKTCPNATRNARIHQLISSFRVRAGDCGAHITSISGTLATRRRRVGGSRGPPIKASLLRLRLYSFAKLWRPTAASTEGARCAARFNGCRQCRRPRRAVGNELNRAAQRAPSVAAALGRQSLAKP